MFITNIRTAILSVFWKAFCMYTVHSQYLHQCLFFFLQAWFLLILFYHIGWCRCSNILVYFGCRVSLFRFVFGPFSLLLDCYLSCFITSLCFGFHSTVMDSSLVLQQPLHSVNVDRNFPFTLSETSTMTHLMSLCMNQARGVAAYVTHPIT